MDIPLIRRSAAALVLGATVLPVAAQAARAAPAASASASASATTATATATATTVVPALQQCVVPAKPGGGFEVTCRLARLALQPAVPDLRLVYQPGGIGALVYHEVVRGSRPAPQELIAFSSGTLLNLAQGRFGRHEPERLRWVAALALDHGVVAVHRDAPWPTLGALLASLKSNPGGLSFAAGGTIGSQDWMKAALLARAVGVSHKAMRVVAFEGGGDAMQALQGRHVQVFCGDAAEVQQQIQQGAPLRILAVLAEQRLGGPLAALPTAREQGIDVHWPILRGVYASSRLPAATLAQLGRQLTQGQQQPAYARELMRLGLQPAALTGAEFERQVAAELAKYRAQAVALGLVLPDR